jgi:hypothetical protein
MDAAALALKSGAGTRVESADDLAAAVADHLGDSETSAARGAAGAEALEAGSESLASTVDLVASVLERSSRGAQS